MRLLGARTVKRVIRYYLTLWLPMFCEEWLKQRRPEHDEKEWLQAGMEQAVDKYMTLVERTMHNNRDLSIGDWIIIWVVMLGLAFWLGMQFAQ